MVKESAFTIEGPSIKLTSYAVTPIVLVFHEMITNAAKYGALSATSNDGRVSIVWRFDENGDIDIQWKEMGGPPLSSIDNEGFGMTIIKSVIPHELGGDVTLSPGLDGLSATFVVPSKYIELSDNDADDDAASTIDISSKSSNNQSSQHRVRENAFIVEDNLLISLNLQKLLKSTGFENIEIFGDLGSVRKVLAKRPPHVVFLDVHLGNENTIPLGLDLKKMGIPFIFITGYGASLELPDELIGTTILTKPVDATLLNEAIISMGFEEVSPCHQ